MEFVDVEGKKESERLANERGPFPEWAQEHLGPGRDLRARRERQAHPSDAAAPQLQRHHRRADGHDLASSPAARSGLEPLFAVAFMRNQAGVMMPDVNEDFVAIAKREGWYSRRADGAHREDGHVDFAEVPAKWQRVFVTANSIAPEWHIRMQAAFQEHCDSAITKTTNFAHAATVEDVREIYELAYDMKCKGVTVYRDGSRDNQVLSHRRDRQGEGSSATGAAPRREEDRRRDRPSSMSTLAEKDAEIERLKKQLYEVEAENLQRRAKRARPDKLRGTTIRKETPLGTMFVNITEDDKGQPFEVFITLGKAGGSAMADAEAMGRLISLALRSGIPLMEIHRQLRGISSDRAVGLGPNKVLSVPDAIGIAIEEWHRDRVTGVQQELMPPTPAVGWRRRRRTW